MGVEKTVYIDIGDEDLRFLKENGYGLCIAKELEGEISTIWSGTSEFLAHNDFSWYPEYQMYASNTRRIDEPGDARTEVRDIFPGQQCTLDEYGILSEAVTGGPKETLNFCNHYRSVYLNLTQKCREVDGNTGFKPIYTSCNMIILGEVGVTPTEKIIIWFKRGEFAVGHALYNSVTLDFSTRDTATVVYRDGGWTVQ